MFKSSIFKKVILVLLMTICLPYSIHSVYAASGSTEVRECVTTYGGDGCNQARFYIWEENVSASADLCLNSEYTLYSDYVHIDNVHTANTSSLFPEEVEVTACGIIGENNQRTVKTYADYKIGNAEVATKTYRVETTINVKALKNSKIYYTAQSKFII